MATENMINKTSWKKTNKYTLERLCEHDKTILNPCNAKEKIKYILRNEPIVAKWCVWSNFNLRTSSRKVDQENRQTLKHSF